MQCRVSIWYKKGDACCPLPAHHFLPQPRHTLLLSCHLTSRQWLCFGRWSQVITLLTSHLAPCAQTSGGVRHLRQDERERKEVVKRMKNIYIRKQIWGIWLRAKLEMGVKCWTVGVNLHAAPPSLACFLIQSHMLAVGLLHHFSLQWPTTSSILWPLQCFEWRSSVLYDHWPPVLANNCYQSLLETLDMRPVVSINLTVNCLKVL